VYREKFMSSLSSSPVGKFEDLIAGFCVPCVDSLESAQVPASILDVLVESKDTLVEHVVSKSRAYSVADIYPMSDTSQ
jgi:hypothetical protein